MPIIKWLFTGRLSCHNRLRYSIVGGFFLGFFFGKGGVYFVNKTFTIKWDNLSKNTGNNTFIEAMDEFYLLVSVSSRFSGFLKILMAEHLHFNFINAILGLAGPTQTL